MMVKIRNWSKTAGLFLTDDKGELVPHTSVPQWWRFQMRFSGALAPSESIESPEFHR